MVRTCWMVFLILLALVVAENTAARAQDADELDLVTQFDDLRAKGRYAEALTVAERYVALARSRHGDDQPAYVYAAWRLARVYQDLGRYADAEQHYLKALSITEKASGPDHPDVGVHLNRLAELYRMQGRYTDAEPLYKRDLAITEKTVGPDDPEVATILHNIALLYKETGRYVEAEALFRRALAIYVSALGADDYKVAVAISQLAQLFARQDRIADYENLYKQALDITQKALGPDHPSVAERLNDLAQAYSRSGRYAEAEPLYQQSLTVAEKALGREHPVLATYLNNLAICYMRQGRYGEAEPLNERALAIRIEALGAEHPDVAISLGNTASLYYAMQDWMRSVQYFRRSTEVITRRMQRGVDVGHGVTGKGKSEADQSNMKFKRLVQSAFHLTEQEPTNATHLAAEMFQAAQWALGSEAASSVNQMAARGAKGQPRLAVLVRERQDLVEEWQKLDSLRSAAIARSPGAREGVREAGTVARLAALDSRIGEIDKRLVTEFADYSTFARPDPLAVEDVQEQLAATEALVLFLDVPQSDTLAEETFIWVVTKTDVRWVRSDMGTSALTDEIAALRCGLDVSQWDDEGGFDEASGIYDMGGAMRCRFAGTAPERDALGNIRTETVSFDFGRAHKLYEALFGQVVDAIREKHLLIVPSKPLTQLPFQVLLTAPIADPPVKDLRDLFTTRPPTTADYRSAPWIVRKHATTVLPAVSSLKALRRLARSSAGKKAMLGIGNPLLDGDPRERPWEAQWAKLALQKQSCRQIGTTRVANLAEKRRSVRSIATPSGIADLDHLRSQPPLHDTADELCAVAKDLGVAPDDILLGARANETSLKKLKLTDYRIIHFATHGTLAGELEGTTEPGLILTPPKRQTEVDDGYLSASEVAVLKLDADWVILSACNTAAGGERGGEALSGLARAFIYAGARSLLVSHWAVNSAATVKLITAAIGATARDKKLGRAEALRRAMITMIDKGEPGQAHPASWAPFVLVGEGAGSTR